MKPKADSKEVMKPKADSKMKPKADELEADSKEVMKPKADELEADSKEDVKLVKKDVKLEADTVVKKDVKPEATGNLEGTVLGGEKTEPNLNDRNRESREELMDRIVKQMEMYFSDENIMSDKFLFYQICQRRAGYFSLHDVTWRLLNHITDDWRLVRTALSRCATFELDESGERVRRKIPFSVNKFFVLPRTILAIGIPQWKASIQYVAELFWNCGPIALVRLLYPGNPIPFGVRPLYDKYPEMYSKVCALIEFVHQESVGDALDWVPGLQNTGIRIVDVIASGNEHGLLSDHWTRQPCIPYYWIDHRRWEKRRWDMLGLEYFDGSGRVPSNGLGSRWLNGSAPGTLSNGGCATKGPGGYHWGHCN